MPNPKPKLLIVEDDSSIATQMKWALADAYEVFLAEDRPTAVEIFKREKPPILTLDLGLPPSPGSSEEGFLALGEILDQDPLAKVIIVTGQEEKANALEAIGKGAYDFFCKPIQINELKIVMGRAEYVSRLERERRDQQANLAEGSFEGMLGNSLQMQAVFAIIRKVAPADAPVLISGLT